MCTSIDTIAAADGDDDDDDGGDDADAAEATCPRLHLLQIFDTHWFQSFLLLYAAVRLCQTNHANNHSSVASRTWCRGIVFASHTNDILLPPPPICWSVCVQLNKGVGSKQAFTKQHQIGTHLTCGTPQQFKVLQISRSNTRVLYRIALVQTGLVGIWP